MPRKRKNSSDFLSQDNMNPLGAAKEEPSGSLGLRSSKTSTVSANNQPAEYSRQTRSMSKVTTSSANAAALAAASNPGRGQKKKKQQQQQQHNLGMDMDWDEDDDDDDDFTTPFSAPGFAASTLGPFSLAQNPALYTPLPPGWSVSAHTPSSNAQQGTAHGSVANFPGWYTPGNPAHATSAQQKPTLGPTGTDNGTNVTQSFPTFPSLTTFPDMFGSLGKFNAQNSQWDPRQSADWDKTEPSAMCKKRMQHDLANSLSDEDCMGIYIQPDEKNITKLYALLIGPKDTPYEGGYFLFYVRCPPDYPLRPPKICGLTTGNGRVRFGPNLYNCGKVCLSILGTWSGPSWTAAMTMSVLLTSIRSLMSVGALRNEPSYENRALTEPAVVAYDRNVRYDTVRVAILDNLDIVLSPGQTTFSEKFCQVMLKSYQENCDTILSLCEVENQQQTKTATSNKPSPKSYPEMHYAMPVSSLSSNGIHDWKLLKDRLQNIKTRVNKALNGGVALSPITIS